MTNLTIWASWELLLSPFVFYFIQFYGADFRLKPKARNFRRVRVREFGARGLDDESESGNSYFMVSKTSPSPGIWNWWSRDRVRETRPESQRERDWICDRSKAKNSFTTIDYFPFPFVFVVFCFSNVVQESCHVLLSLWNWRRGVKMKSKILPVCVFQTF